MLQKINHSIAEYRSYNLRDKMKWWKRLLIGWAIYLLILVFIVYIAIRFPSFISISSLMDILKRTSAYGIMALGMGGIIVLAGTDLSAGRMLGLMACVAASLEQSITFTAKMFPGLDPLHPLLVLLLLLAIGAVCGFINGFCTTKFKIHPFIVTLATQLILYGLTLIYVQFGTNGGKNITGLDERYSTLVKGNIFSIGDISIPYYVLYFIIIAIIVWIIWNKTSLGKNMYAVGANPEAAEVSGVSVFGTTIAIFMIAGMLYGIAAFIEAARIGSNTATTGANYELDAIAACVIGGVSFTGGVGTIRGIITGVVLLQLISIGLQWLGVSASLTYVIKGLIILIAVIIDKQKYLTRK